MKKLLLILICLFVSFEVKSKEVILKCIMTYEQLIGQKPIKVDKTTKIPPETEILYLNKDKKYITQEPNDPYIDYSEYYNWRESDSEIIFDRKNGIKTITLNLYDGSIKIKNKKSVGGGEYRFIKTGKCEKIKGEKIF